MDEFGEVVGSSTTNIGLPVLAVRFVQTQFPLALNASDLPGIAANCA